MTIDIDSRFGGKTNAILHQSFRRALQLGYQKVEPEHILLAMIRHGDNRAYDSLVDLLLTSPLGIVPPHNELMRRLVLGSLYPPAAKTNPGVQLGEELSRGITESTHMPQTWPKKDSHRFFPRRTDGVRAFETCIALHAEHVQAEWVKARTIETVEQLDALPDDSVVLVDDCPARKHMGDWYFANDDGDSYGSRSLALYLPARLLWHPEADHG